MAWRARRGTSRRDTMRCGVVQGLMRYTAPRTAPQVYLDVTEACGQHDAGYAANVATREVPQACRESITWCNIAVWYIISCYGMLSYGVVCCVVLC